MSFRYEEKLPIASDFVDIFWQTEDPTPVHYKKGNQNFGMRLKVGVFFTHVPAADATDTTETLPMPSGDTFLLGGHVLSVPSYEHMDGFVQHLVTLDLLSSDSFVQAAIQGMQMGVSKRSTQRHFSQATGVTQAHFKQVERAWRAAKLLQSSMPIMEVVHELGYADQAHLSRSLKRITGYTPGQSAKRDEPIG